jgi:predicted lipoprotein with Yx(FWY)xxD motif
MKKSYFLLMFMLLIVSGILVTRCKWDGQDAVVGAAIDPLFVKLATSATLGSIMTDKDGNTLYFFANDGNGANNCTGGCTTAWPNFNVADLAQTQLADGLVLADFSSITTPGGNQLTFKGWPLYYYAPGGVREAPGKTTGDGVGGVWFVAKPDYTIMLAKEQIVGIDNKSYIVAPTNVYSEGTGTTTYMTDLAGRTLYSFFRDSTNINKFTKADFSNNPVWPIYETDKIVVPSTLDKTLFNSITVYGKKQLTYNGWPMYYYGADVDNSGKFRGYNKGVYGPMPVKWPVFFKAIPHAPMK